MGMVRSWLVTAVYVVVFLGFTVFVGVLVTGHAPPRFTEQVRQTVRDTVQRVMRLFSGHHGATGANGDVFWPLSGLPGRGESLVLTAGPHAGLPTWPPLAGLRIRVTLSG